MKSIKICPQCGSTDIKIPRSGMDIKMTMKDMCQECGFIGNFPEVELDKVEEFRKKCRK